MTNQDEEIGGEEELGPDGVTTGRKSLTVAKQMNQPEDAAAFEERMTDGVEAYIAPEDAPTPPIPSKAESEGREAMLDAQSEMAEQAEIEEEFGPDDSNEKELKQELGAAMAAEGGDGAKPLIEHAESGTAQSIDVPQIEGVNEIHGLAEALNKPVAESNFVYHIFAQVIQPGTIGMICGLYAFPFRIATPDTYRQARMLVANQNNTEIGKLMFVNFILLDG